MEDFREQLFNILYKKSFLYREDPPFVLASGKKSCYYFDCKATTLDQEGLFLAGKVMFESVKELLDAGEIDAIGGLTLGADPISLSTSIAARMEGYHLNPLIVRKEPKKHGTEKWIEGDLEGVTRVLAIDDVITTGGSTVKAIERMRESGLIVNKGAVIIDREEGGRENIEACDIEVISLYKRTDFDRKRLAQSMF